MIKYIIVAYTVLSFLFFYEVGMALSAKNVISKKVQGISTQIKAIEDYQKEVSDFNSGY